MSRQVYNANELAEVLGISASKAYDYIRQMNDELQKKGFLVVRGKVPVAYVEERFFGISPCDAEIVQQSVASVQKQEPHQMDFAEYESEMPFR